MMTQLTPHDAPLYNSPTIQGAYSQILQLEEQEQAAYSREPTEDRGKRLMHARIVGYLMLQGPSNPVKINSNWPELSRSTSDII